MNVTPQPVAKSAPPVEPEAIRHNKLVAAYFLQSIAFAGQAFSVRVPATADLIVPARLEWDGTAVAIAKGERSDGILIRKKAHDAAKGQWVIRQAFVAWANCAELSYGE